MLNNKFSYPEFKHLAYINQLRANIHRPLSLNLSDSCGASYSVAEILALEPDVDLTDIQLTYTSMQGSAALRQAIVDVYQPLQQKQKLDPEWVITYSGAQEAIFGVCNAVLTPGDEVICFTPNYPSLTQLPQQLGAKLIEIPVVFDQCWKFDISRLAAQISTKTKLIVINSPHNPSGAVLTQQQADDLRDLAAEHGIYILADEVSVFSDHQQLGLNYGFLEHPKTISIGVMSKSFGLAGVRVGWMICREPQTYQKLLQIKGYGSICGSAMDEQLATIALTHAQLLLERNNNIIRNNIYNFQQLVNKYQHALTWAAPKAGIMSLVKFAPSLPVDIMAQQLAHNHQTLLLPGHLFGRQGNEWRLGLGRQDLPVALAALEQVIAGYLPK